MVIGQLIFAVASLACGFATTSLLLNVARAAQGLGGAFLLTASLAIIGNTFKGAERTRAFALLGGRALASPWAHFRCWHETDVLRASGDVWSWG
jgi:MFS family permease